VEGQVVIAGELIHRGNRRWDTFLARHAEMT